MTLLSIITVIRNDTDALSATHDSLGPLLKEAAVEWLIQDGSDIPNDHLVTSHYQWGHDLGIYDAMRRGLSRATGQWVWFLHAGDLVPSTTPPESILAAARASAADVLCASARLISTRRGRNFVRKAVPVHVAIRHGLPANQQATLYRRSELVAVLHQTPSQFDVSEDYLWSAKLYQRGSTFESTDLLLAEFYFGGISTTKFLTSAKECWHIQREVLGLPLVSRLTSLATRLVKGTVIRWIW